MYLMIAIVLFVVYSNIITGRQLSLFGITMTGGTFLFPLTYIVSDIFQEVYGYKWSRRSSYIAFIGNALIAILSIIFVNLPAPTHFGKDLIQAYQIVLGNTPRFLVASLAAFFLGDLVNDKIFAKMKSKHIDSTKGFGIRAIASSIGGQAIDGLTFNVIGFLGAMPLLDMIISIPAGIVFSIIIEILVLPLTTFLVKKIIKYESEIKDE